MYTFVIVYTFVFLYYIIIKYYTYFIGALFVPEPVYKPAPPWLTDDIFPFHRRLPLPGWSWSTGDAARKVSCWTTAKKSRQSGASRAGQSRAERSSPRGAWLQRRLAAVWLHNWAVRLLSCSPAVLFSQLCCITTELLALNKVSLITTPQIRDSCWHWILLQFTI